MKRVWKPIGVGGMRLYRVKVVWTPSGTKDGHKEDYIVAANAPRHAAQLIEEMYKEAAYPPTIVTGEALNVYQPADWWESGIPCEHTLSGK